MTHVALGVGALALWVTSTVTGVLVWAWAAFALLTVGNGVGDSLLIARSRRTRRRSEGFFPDYGAAIAGVFRGEMPWTVVFHALFSGVVYFTCLGVCIGATMSGA